MNSPISSTDLLRQARSLKLREVFESNRPQPEARFHSPAALKRFKCQQRQYDSLALELNLTDAASVQAKNSVQRPDRRPVLVGSL